VNAYLTIGEELRAALIFVDAARHLCI